MESIVLPENTSHRVCFSTHEMHMYRVNVRIGEKKYHMAAAHLVQKANMYSEPG